jgi:signal transduction histidine kinase
VPGSSVVIVAGLPVVFNPPAGKPRLSPAYIKPNLSRCKLFMASLFVVRGQDQGKHFHLEPGVNKIGRDRQSEIQLHDSESSRHHAEIRSNPEQGFELTDLQSSNGTAINGQRVDQPKTLKSGDRIEIGSTLLIFTGTNRSTTSIADLGAGVNLQAGVQLGDSGSGNPAGGINDLADGIDSPADGIDVVQQSRADESRIVSSLDPSVSQFAMPGDLDQADHSRSEADRSLEVMYLTAIAVGRTDDLPEVLKRVLRLVFDWVEADRGCIMLLDQQSGELRPAARCDRDGVENDARGKPISISQTILQWVLEKKRGVRTSDARDDARFESAASIVTGGVREALCVPLQGRYGIVGTLYVDTYTTPADWIASQTFSERDAVAKKQSQKFSDDHLRLITAIGHQAALAIEDTTYYSALVQNERLAVMGQTIATLSHHIKNILQGISGGSYLIEAGLQRDDTDAVRRGWGIVDRNQERISNLVMDMLTFSKEREPQRSDGELNETVSDVIELMQTRAAELKVQLTGQLGENLPLASFDPDGMHRAIMNLVTNAIDAASGEMTLNREPASDEDQTASNQVPSEQELSEQELSDQELSDQELSNQASPVVTVRTGFDPKTGWWIDVADNGPGIAPEDREAIFSLFESSKGMRGTGLGLPVSAKILEEHGGSIRIVSTPGVKGTCFRMRLPSTGTQATS